MSSDKVVLAVEPREALGKKVRALRDSGSVPAVIYEKGKDSVHVMAPYAKIAQVYKQAGRHHVIELQVGTAKHLALIQSVDLDPVKSTLRHVSFHAIKQNEKVHAEIEIKLDGQAPAEKAGLIVLRPTNSVEVKALPADLPDTLTVSAATLTEEGSKLTVADIVAPKGVEIEAEEDLVIAIVEAPRAAVEEVATEEVSAADVPAAHGGDTETPEA